MNVWMKRALQTGLFTGGLLALGTGIASADDNAIDVTVPVTVTDNAQAVLGTAGTTPAEIGLPPLDGTIAADLDAITLSIPVTVGGNAADAAVLDVAQPAAAPATGGTDGSVVDADVPVTVTGNAVAVLGNASAGGTAPAAGVGGGGGGSSASLADIDVPVLVCGNGIGVLGDASGTCTGPAGTTPGIGGVSTVGVDVPVTACGNGTSVLGSASGDCSAPAGTPVVPAVPPVSGQPGTFPGVVAPAASGLPLPRNGSTNGGATSGTSPDGQLAYTGTAATGLLVGGLLALLLGLGLTVLSRRRVPLG